MINSIQTEISYWVVKRSYSVKRIDGLEYIIPDEDIPLTIANPLEHEKRLLCDALNLGRRLKENEPRFHSAMVLDLVSKYGLLGIMTDITNTDMNAYDMVFVNENMFIPKGIVDTQKLAQIFFPADKKLDIFEEVHLPMKLRGRSDIYSKMFMMEYRYAECTDWLIRYFTSLYEFHDCGKEKLGHFPKPNVTYKIDVQYAPLLVREYASLKAMIDFSFAKAITNEARPLRYCKHCGNIFYANDIRSEFCSPKCRNQFNVYRSRAKH